MLMTKLLIIVSFKTNVDLPSMQPIKQTVGVLLGDGLKIQGKKYNEDGFEYARWNRGQAHEKISVKDVPRPHILNQIFQFLGMTKRLFSIDSDVSWTNPNTDSAMIELSIKESTIPAKIKDQYLSTLNDIKHGSVLGRIDDIEWLRVAQKNHRN